MTRLETAVSLIPNNSYVIDVGCDHGILDIELVKAKQCHCLAIDINAKTIAKAVNNIKKAHLEDKIDILINDGITNLNISSDTFLVIMGLGTFNILKILNNKVLCDNLIISSNNDNILLRKRLLEIGYSIKKEKLVFERNKFYIIIHFYKKVKRYTKQDLVLGPILRKEKPIYYYDYINNILDNYQLYQKHHKNKEINNIVETIRKELQK